MHDNIRDQLSFSPGNSMRLLLAIIAVFFWGLQSKATDLSVSYDLNLMHSFLGSLVHHKNLPDNRDNTIPISEKEIPKWLKDFSALVQKQIIGKEMIRVAFCGEDNQDTIMTAEYKHGIICLHEKDIENILNHSTYHDSRNLIRFFLAHEISHFIHEFSTSVNEPFNKSLNLTMSAYQYPFDVFVKEKLGHNNYEKMNAQELATLPTLGNEFVLLLSLMHAEVDTYAYLIYSVLNLPIPYSDLLMMFNMWVSTSTDDGSIDAQRRINGLLYFQNNFGGKL